MNEERRGCGSTITRIKIDGLRIGKIVFLDTTRTLRQFPISKEKVFVFLYFDPLSLFFYFLFFSFLSTRRNEFFYSISIPVFCPSIPPPLTLLFWTRKNFCAACDIEEDISRHRSLHCIFSSLLSAYSPYPYHNFATTLLFIF